MGTPEEERPTQTTMDGAHRAPQGRAVPSLIPCACPFPAGPTGGPRHLLRQHLPVHRGEQEVEEPFLRGAPQLRAGPL